MGKNVPAARPAAAPPVSAPPARLNEFTVQVATVNGTGSQSANNVLLRALFQMGVPVSGKNMFPSNIKGLPTWFSVRVSEAGYVARRRETDVLLCLNPRSAAEDLSALRPGALCVYDAPLRLQGRRADVRFFEVPFAKLIETIPGTDARLRTLLANTCYVGVLAELLRIERAEVERALQKQLGHKSAAVALNRRAVALGAEYAREHFKGTMECRVERRNLTQGKIIVDGNSAAAMGALMAGCTFLAWYPITPSSSLCETFIALAEEHRRDPQTGKAAYAAVQAEDELASIGMVLGAGWAGARAMTATSGPGISLMGELAGFGYYAEIPAVIFDVQRAGPSTGLPTRTQQADLLQVAYLSHGDTRHLAVIPGTPEECYSMAMEAFDLAERFQTPVFVLSDLDLGMNNWMSDPLPYPEKPFDRGKVLSAGDLEKLTASGQNYGRYEDRDGDGIPYRVLPGNAHPASAFLTRGSGHNAQARYTEDPQAYRENLERIARKYETARQWVPKPLLAGERTAELGLLAFGSTHCAVEEARDQLDAVGVETEYLRVRGLPFHKSVAKFVGRHRTVYVIEQNRDAQMLALLKADLPAELCPRFRSILHYGGLPIDARTISEGVLKDEGKSEKR